MSYENNKVAIIGCVRKKSQRCKNKILRKFGNTSLIDIFLSKLKKIKNADKFLVGYELIFKKKSKQFKVDFIQRSKHSSQIDGPALKIHSYLKNLNYKYILIVNVCVPFLKVSTIQKFLDNCIKTKKPSFAVLDIKNYFLDSTNKPINFSIETKNINTKIVKNIKKFAHIFYFFKRDYFLKNGSFWNWKNVNYVTIKESLETTDIDTEEDFFKAVSCWKNLKF